ncbi:MAG: UvrD-helicase domain-containing protein, partial [Bacteroidota bacterium]
MAEALPPVGQLTFPDFRVVTASAGSGKTTTLTKRFLQFLLADSIPHHKPQNILAITFTNNAAAEMKERILSMLKLLALGDEKTVKDVAELTGILPKDLPARADNLLETIFNSFSEFQVRTIDSFLSNVFKAAAVEFGFPPDYAIALSADGLLDRAFREYSARIADDPGGMDLLRELVVLQDEQRRDDDPYLWDPYAAIASRVRALHKEAAKVPDPIVVPNLGPAQREAERLVFDAARTLDSFIRSSGCQPSHHLVNDLAEVLAGRVASVLGRSVKSKVFTAGKTKNDKEAVAAHTPEADLRLATYGRALHAYGLLQVRRVFVPYARALQLMEQTLDDIKRREGTVLLDDVNRALGAYLRQDVLPEVYLKLGDRLAHYLIDEFQDTSPIQYNALKPLWDETLAKDGSLFVVGDTKQSIYGFRGADYRIMRDMMQREVFPSAPRQLATLEKNYRSRRSIVAFNHTVFRETLPASDLNVPAEASGLSTDAQEVGLPDKLPGRARVIPVQRDAATEPELAAVAAVVRGWRAQGYSWRDMAVLTPSNANVVRVSSCLNAENIPFISQSSLDIRNRKVIAELLALLRFLDAPVDDGAFATFLLSDLFDRSGSGLDRTAVRGLLAAAAQERDRPPLYKLVQAGHPAVWRGFIEKLFTRVGYLPLYDLVADLMKTFRVFERFPDEEASLVRFFETVRETEATGRNSVRDLVRAADGEGEDVSWELPSPRGHNAVTVMTVHKAKGLGFPAVCVLLFPREFRVGQPLSVPTDEGLELWRVTKETAERYPEVARQYEDALLRKEVDELNSLYVSLTRAKVELAVVSAYDDETDLPHRLLPATKDDGTPAPAAEPDPFEPTPEARLWHDTSEPPGAEPFDGPLHIREIRRGDMMHEVL